VIGYAFHVTATLPPLLRIVDLGVREFGEVWNLQLETVAARQRNEVPDTLLLVEHPHVITLGRGAHRENVLRADGIPVFAIERGGDVTYHGPGQLVGYPILAFKDDERDLHLYMRRIEELLIRVSSDFGVSAGRRAGATGVWTEGESQRKLASIGVAVKKWVTMHGFALNVATDLSRFSVINPCGFEARVMTSLSNETGQPVEMDAVKRRVVQYVGDVFHRLVT
jgi:lipoate-protein ligase B